MGNVVFVTDQSGSFAANLLEMHRGPLGAINALLLWQLAIWQLWFDEPPGIDSDRERKGHPIDSDRLLACIDRDLSENFGRNGVEDFCTGLIEHLQEQQLAWKTQTGETIVSVKALEPMRLVRSFFGQTLAEHELRYYVFASIRRRYQCSLSADTARIFHTLADTVNRDLIQPAARTAESAGQSQRLRWNLRQTFLPTLKTKAESLGKTLEEQRSALKLFIGVARAVNYIQVDARPGYIVCRTRSVDAEYMTSSLFGLPTRIRGFDDLFGGGLLLVEAAPFAKGERIKGRIILTTGRYATGKSLLGLQIATEVARKGGVAWVLALEQPAEECLYTLQAMGLLPNDESLELARNTPAAFELLQNVQREAEEARREGRPAAPRRGALIFVKAEKTSYEKFLQMLPEPAEWMQLYPLRMILVDPINAIDKGPSPDLGKLRIDTLKIFEQIKDSGTNVWFNAEDNVTNDRSFFEQNVADTVIHLSAENVHGDVQRYIEIQKSRLQREQSGKHPFDIVTGSGIRIYPSSGAFSNRIRSRNPTMPTKDTQFGLSTLDEVLGPHAIRLGDIVVLHGPAGCYKTQLGLRFLAHTDAEIRRANARAALRNVAFVTGDSELGLRQLFNEQPESGTTTPIDVCSLPDGHVHPGQVLQAIEEYLTRNRRADVTVNRVLFSNILHWEMSCPYLRDDEIFVNTLLELLRRQSVTSLLVCVSPLNDRSRLQDAIIENADCVIEFHNTDLQGRSQVILRVVKSRGIRHRRGWFELDEGPESVRVLPTPSLLRVGADGNVSRIPVRLLLHSETDMQSAYNVRVQHSLMASVSRLVEVEEQRHLSLDRVLRLSRYSVLDELQLIQLDEHQIPFRTRNGDPMQFREFPTKLNDESHWNDLLPRLQRRIQIESGQIIAVPYFQNISLMACTETVDDQCITSWHRLAAECDRFGEMQGNGPGEVYFDFPKDSGENYNCLYIEMLLALAGPPENSSDCALQEWLNRPEAVEALVLFWRLCHKPHSIRSGQLNQELQSMRVNPEACVWRHWYTTLNQMLSEMTPSDRSKIRVQPLPGEVSSAGEWFLAVPAYSAAPELAIAMVQDLTNLDAELERVRHGVGLPTRRSYYDFTDHNFDLSSPVSPYFSMRIGILKKLVSSAFGRSMFGCYPQFSSTLTSHLHRLLEMRAFSESDAYNVRRSMILRLQHIRFDTQDCARCRTKG